MVLPASRILHRIDDFVLQVFKGHHLRKSVRHIRDEDEPRHPVQLRRQQHLAGDESHIPIQQDEMPVDAEAAPSDVIRRYADGKSASVLGIRAVTDPQLKHLTHQSAPCGRAHDARPRGPLRACRARAAWRTP